MTTELYAQCDTLPGACGIGLLNAYKEIKKRDRGNHWWYLGDRITKINIRNNGGGTGFNISNFVNTELDKKVYDHLTSTYKVEYQSPVRQNSNSGNQFFFIVFDVRHKPTEDQAKWPFKVKEQK